MPSSAEEARGLPARVAELEEASKTKTSKLWAQRRIMNMEVVSEQAHKKRAEYTTRIVSLKVICVSSKGSWIF